MHNLAKRQFSRLVSISEGKPWQFEIMCGPDDYSWLFSVHRFTVDEGDAQAGWVAAEVGG